MTSRRWLAPASLVALALMFACLKGRGPTDAGASDVRFALHTQVTSTAGSDLHVRVVYLDQPATGDTTPVPVNLVDQRFPVTTGTIRLPLTVDLSRCLADPRRLVPGTLCQLIVSIALEQNGVAVDSTTLPPVAVVPGQVIDDTTSVSAVGQVKVVPAETSVAVGGTVQLSDTVFDINNVALPGHAVTWASAADTVATVNATGLVTGVRAGTTQITASAGGQVGTALLTVTPGAAGGGGLTLQIGTVSFSAPAGGTLPANGFIGVTSSDTTTVGGLTATVTYGAGATGWLSANVSDSSFGSVATKPKPGLGMSGLAMSGLRSRLRAQGSVHALAGSNVTTPATLDVVPNTTGLAVGTYTATVTVSGSGGQTATLNVSYAISSGALIESNPPSMLDTANAGGSPVTKPIAIFNGGTGSLSGLSTSITFTNGTGWATATLNSPTAPDTVSVTMKPATLAAGDYAAVLTVSSSLAGVPPRNIALEFEVLTGPTLGFSAPTLNFSQYKDGSTLAGAQTTTAINTGTGTLGQVSEAGAITYGSGATGWLTLSVSGTTITAQPNTAALPLGNFTSTIPFNAVGATNNPQLLTVNVGSGVTYTKVVVGETFACGLTTAGTVYCWGTETFGELGNGVTSLVSATPLQAQIPGLGGPNQIKVTDVSAGENHVCVLLSTSIVDCWGRNDRGQAGTGTAGGPVLTPTAVTGTWKAISAGGLFTCAIETGATAYVECWGDNSKGQLGSGTTDANTHPVPTNSGFFMYTSVSAGFDHACGIQSGSVECWGSNVSGQVGNGQSADTVPSAQFAPLASGAVNAVSVSAGNGFSCATDTNGNAWCWGDNQFGELGLGTTSTTPTVTPTEITNVGGFTVLSAGFEHACGVSNGLAVCWGDNTSGELGTGTAGSPATLPTTVLTGGASSFQVATAAGVGSVSCIILGSSDSVGCFGDATKGQMGNGSTTGQVAQPGAVSFQPTPPGVNPSHVVPRRPGPTIKARQSVRTRSR